MSFSKKDNATNSTRSPTVLRCIACSRSRSRNCRYVAYTDISPLEVSTWHGHCAFSAIFRAWVFSACSTCSSVKLKTRCIRRRHHTECGRYYSRHNEGWSLRQSLYYLPKPFIRACCCCCCCCKRAVIPVCRCGNFSSITTTTSLSFTPVVNRARCPSACSDGLDRYGWSGEWFTPSEVVIHLSVASRTAEVRPSRTSYLSARCIARSTGTPIRYSEKNATCQWPLLMYVTLSGQLSDQHEIIWRNYACLGCLLHAFRYSSVVFAALHAFSSAPVMIVCHHAVDWKLTFYILPWF